MLRGGHGPATAQAYPEAVIELRLIRPALDFLVDFWLGRFEGAWLEGEDLAPMPEVAVAPRHDLAVLLAIWPAGPALARRLVSRAVLPA